MLLVDVREPNEVAAEAFPGAVVVPLSAFDPAQIPDPQAREVVFACRSGKRSVTASQAAQAAGPALRRASCGRHPRLEGRRPSDRELKCRCGGRERSGGVELPSGSFPSPSQTRVFPGLAITMIWSKSETSDLDAEIGRASCRERV